jgi:hypothetical protein
VKRSAGLSSRGRRSDHYGEGDRDLEQHQARAVVEQTLRLHQRLHPGRQHKPPTQRADRHRSVLARTAPSTNAMLTDSDATTPATAATAATEASTRPTASTTTGSHTARRSRHDSSSLAAYSSGGSTTRLTTDPGLAVHVIYDNLSTRRSRSPASSAGARSAVSMNGCTKVVT